MEASSSREIDFFQNGLLPLLYGGNLRECSTQKLALSNWINARFSEGSSKLEFSMWNVYVESMISVGKGRGGEEAGVGKECSQVPNQPWQAPW